MAYRPLNEELVKKVRGAPPFPRSLREGGDFDVDSDLSTQTDLDNLCDFYFLTPTSLSPRVLRHFPIHDGRHIFPRIHIADLHHTMPLPRQFPPSARLLRILFNRLILSPTHLKPHRAKSSRPRPLHLNRPFPKRHDTPAHHLLRDSFQGLVIQHMRHVLQKPPSDPEAWVGCKGSIKIRSTIPTATPIKDRSRQVRRLPETPRYCLPPTKLLL